jgi:hypothetical protein
MALRYVSDRMAGVVGRQQDPRLFFVPLLCPIERPTLAESQGRVIVRAHFQIAHRLLAAFP